MRLFNGADTLEFEKQKQSIFVNLEKTQVKVSELEEINQYVLAKQTDRGVQLRYTLQEGLLSFSQASNQAKTQLEKLELANLLRPLRDITGDYQIPFIHPENLYFEGEKLKIIHFGLKGLVTPQVEDVALFLKEVKALILSIFQSKVTYEKCLEGLPSLKDSFSRQILAAENLEELFAFLNTELKAEKTKINQSKRLVSKSGFTVYRVLGVIALVFAIIMTFFCYRYKTSSDKSDAIVTAQTSFITNNYAKTQTDLEKYKPEDLPKSAKYILAVSSVNLADLTSAQKQTILNTLSIKTDNNTLNYWVNMGRGNFDEALNLAQNLGDDQLTLLAYTDLYQATKLNTTMAGDKKQKRLQEYRKQIEDLTKKLGN